MAAIATSSTSSTLTKSGTAVSSRPAVPVTRVAIRDGKTIAINDHIYVSAPWAPGSGEPYIVARVMEFVTASAARKGAQTVASSSGTLQVRANIYLRQRDITHRNLHDPRLLVATMHSDVFALENIRGVCVVRHRDLLGDAPAVSSWKRKDDHFYYHQLYDRYLHKLYDVIPTEKLRNAPEEVLAVLRSRYSFIAAEIGMASDLCGALRACSICNKWAAGAESVRCDTCKKFFHMSCLSPPLVSKPAKGYSWTCAPCSKRREQSQENTESGDHIHSTNGSRIGSPFTAGALPDGYTPKASSDTTAQYRIGPKAIARNRARNGLHGGRKSFLPNGERVDSDSRESSPSSFPHPERATLDDERGTRSFNRWPYRYFGEHTLAHDVLDPYDSIYPRATPRIGIKFQGSVISWEEQEALGLGVYARPQESVDGPLQIEETTYKAKKNMTKSSKKRKDENSTANTPTLPPTQLPDVAATSGESTTSTPQATLLHEKEFERGVDENVEVIYQPGRLSDKLIDRYIGICQQQFPQFSHDVGLLNTCLRILMSCNGNGVQALADVSRCTPENFEYIAWSSREAKQFERMMHETGAEMRSLKKAFPNKKPGNIVRHFYQWKCNKLKEHFEEERKRASEAVDGKQPSQDLDHSTIRAVSPSVSLWGPEDGTSTPTSSQQGKVCKMCATPTSTVWYKGPYVWTNRRLCVNCGMYWRKYAAEIPSEISTRKREAAGDDGALGVAPPLKALRSSRSDSVKNASAASTPPPSQPKFEPGKCVMCKKLEPKRRLVQCRQCSLSVHQGCYGLVNADMAADVWFCDACSNEKSLDAALIPHCILCPPPPPLPALPPVQAPTHPPAPRQIGRPRKSANLATREGVIAAALNARSAPLDCLDAFKPTECNNWTHLLCALFITEIVFTEPEHIKLVEGAGSLQPWRYESACDLCHKHIGACVTCADPTCKRTFHVSCASQQSNFTLGLDLTPVKVSRRDTVTTATFKGETGHFAAVVYCNIHKDAARSRKLIDLSDMDPDSGSLVSSAERDHKNEFTDTTKEKVGPEGADGPLTAMQIFVATHKSVRNHLTNSASASHTDQNTYPLLRRAKRFDAVLGGLMSSSAWSSSSLGSRRSVSGIPNQTRSAEAEDDKSTLLGLHHEASSIPSLSPPHCVRCGTEYSPFWWDVPSNAVEAEHQDTTPHWLSVYHRQQRMHEKTLLCVQCRHAILPVMSP